MPKLMTFRQHRFTGRLFNYTITTDSTGAEVLTYHYTRDVNMNVDQGLFGRLTIIFTDDGDDVMIRSRIENLRDKAGKEIFPGGIWQLSGVAPIINSFSIREGFRADAKLIATGA